MKRCPRFMSALLLVALTIPTQAAPNSTQRVLAFSRLPNWSGLWEQYNVGESGLAATQAVADVERTESTEGPPYNPEWQARYESLVEAQAGKLEPVICTFGFPTLMIWSPLMFQAIVTPEETTLLFSQREARHIHTDGSPMPSNDARWPMPWGYSIGHWEGQTLAAETVATSSPLVRFIARDNGLLRVFAPLSDRARFVERIRMKDPNTLEDRITIEDPVALAHSWSLTRLYHRVPNMTNLVEEDCLGNDRNPVVNGNFTIAPP